MVPSDRSAPPHKLNPPLVTGGEVLVDGNLGPTFSFSPDGSSVYYVADQVTNGTYELFRIPLAGGAAVRVNGALVAGGDVGLTEGSAYAHHAFELSRDGRFVLYMADQRINGMVELFSARTDGSQAPRLLSALPTGADVRVFQQSSTGRVVYRARLSNGAHEIHGTTLDAPGPPDVLAVDVSPTTWLLSPESRRVLYSATPTDPTVEILAARLDGGGTSLVNGPLVPGGSVFASGTGAPSFRVTSDGTLAVYVADQDVPGVTELYATVLPPAFGPPPHNRAR